MLDNTIPQKLQDLIRRELQIGESIAWSGMPVPTFFAPTAIGSFLFGIPWTAFAVFWTLAAGFGTGIFRGGLNFFSFFPLFGVPFILIGIGMLLAPVMHYRKSRQTAYLITDKRAIVFEGGRSTSIRSFSPEKLQDLYRTEKSNGIGDVIFKDDVSRDSDGDQRSVSIGFMRVRDVKGVEDRLKYLASKRSGRTTSETDSPATREQMPPESPYFDTYLNQ